MRAEFSWTLQDYKEVQKAYYKVKPKARFFSWFFLVLGVLVIANGVLMYTAGFESADKALEGAIPGIAIILVWWYLAFGVHKRQFEKQARLRNNMVLEISDAGYHQQTESSNSEMKWSVFESWTEMKTIFALLMKETRIMHMIPKRALNDADLGELRAILERQIPNHVK